MFIGELSGYIDLDGDDEVACCLLRGDALASDAMSRSRRGAGLQAQQDALAVERRHVDVAPQSQLGERHWDLDREVVAISTEQAVTGHVAFDDEVSWRAAVAAGGAAPFQSDLLAVGNAGSMRACTSRGRRSVPLPWHVGHGSVTMTPRPPQTRHGDENENSPWFSSTTPRPPQFEQTFGCVPGLAPLPWHVPHCASLVR